MVTEAADGPADSAASGAPDGLIESEAPGPALVYDSDTDSRTPCYVIVHNVSKRHNIGTLARSCAAFGVKEVCLVGSRQFNAFGSHGASDFVSFRHFVDVEDCCRTLKQQKDCQIVGVEITDDALEIQSHPFTGPTAFMIGNEGTGLSERQMSLCDAFVYIPHYSAGTASLNVTVATSIVLHHFAVWAGYAERARDQHKFVVGEKPQRTTARGVVPLTQEELYAEQQRRQQRREQPQLVDELDGDEGDICSELFDQ